MKDEIASSTAQHLAGLVAYLTIAIVLIEKIVFVDQCSLVILAHGVGDVLGGCGS